MIQLLIPAVIAIASFAGAWQIQAQRYERQLSDLRAEQSEALAEATRKAHEKTVLLQRKVDDAQRLAQQRKSALDRSVSASRNELGRVQDAAASAVRRASESHTACLADAQRLAQVFGRCSVRLQDVAADADRIASDRQTLIDSWPQLSPAR